MAYLEKFLANERNVYAFATIATYYVFKDCRIPLLQSFDGSKESTRVFAPEFSTAPPKWHHPICPSHLIIASLTQRHCCDRTALLHFVQFPTHYTPIVQSLSTTSTFPPTTRCCSPQQYCACIQHSSSTHPEAHNFALRLLVDLFSHCRFEH